MAFDIEQKEVVSLFAACVSAYRKAQDKCSPPHLGSSFLLCFHLYSRIEMFTSREKCQKCSICHWMLIPTGGPSGWIIKAIYIKPCAEWHIGHNRVIAMLICKISFLHVLISQIHTEETPKKQAIKGAACHILPSKLRRCCFLSFDVSSMVH